MWKEHYSIYMYMKSICYLLQASGPEKEKLSSSVLYTVEYGTEIVIYFPCA